MTFQYIYSHFITTLLLDISILVNILIQLINYWNTDGSWARSWRCVLRWLTSTFPSAVLFKKTCRFQQNTAMGCCSAPVQRGIRQPAQSGDAKQSSPSAPMRIRTHQIVCLFKTHARPTTSAGLELTVVLLSRFKCLHWKLLICWKLQRKKWRTTWKLNINCHWVW